MVKLTGPCFSLTASGTLGDTITYSNWKGTPYARQRVVPTNPKTAAQSGVRSMFAFLAAAWAAIAALSQATWDAAAAANSYSAFNAYMSSNMLRWRNHNPPTQASPAAEASTPLTVSNMTLTGGLGFINIALTPSAATNIWGFEIYRDDAEITTPSTGNCIAVIPADAGNAVEFNDTGLAAGTYHYRAAVINTDGVRGTVIADDSEAAT